MRPAPLRRLAGVLALGAACGCREGSEQGNVDFLPIVPPAEGTQGCAPAGATAAATQIFASASFGPLSQIAAARTGVAGTDTLYWTAADGSVHELTVPTGGGAPSDATLLPAGTIEAEYLLPAGIAAPAELSGIAVLDAMRLVVAEHASNTLVAVHRTTADVLPLAGNPDPDGGFASGLGDFARFDFTAPAPLLADSAGLVWVGDTGNHAVRQVDLDIEGFPGFVFVATVAGAGGAGSGDGSLGGTLLDTPSGFATNCAFELLVVEAGAAGDGGNVLKSLRVGSESVFGGRFDGSSLVLAGDGTPATTEGVDALAQLDAPMGLVATDDGRVLWIDSGGAILRRYDFATGRSDCPMFADCASAVVGPSPFSGDSFSLAAGESGAVYVLGSAAGGGTLWRLDP